MNKAWHKKQTQHMAAMLELLSPALHEMINKEPLIRKNAVEPNHFILITISPDPDGDGTAVFSYASSAPMEPAFAAMKEFVASFEERVKKARN